MNKKDENRPLILFVHDDCKGELSFTPKHGRIVDLTELNPKKTTCGNLIKQISLIQSDCPGDNIFLLRWDVTSCALLGMRDYDVVAVIPKYLDCMKSSCWEALIFRLNKDVTLKDIKKWMIALQIVRFPILKKLFPKLKKFY